MLSSFARASCIMCFVCLTQPKLECEAPIDLGISIWGVLGDMVYLFIAGHTDTHTHFTRRRKKKTFFDVIEYIVEYLSLICRLFIRNSSTIPSGFSAAPRIRRFDECGFSLRRRVGGARERETQMRCPWRGICIMVFDIRLQLLHEPRMFLFICASQGVKELVWYILRCLTICSHVNDANYRHARLRICRTNRDRKSENTAQPRDARARMRHRNCADCAVYFSSLCARLRHDANHLSAVYKCAYARRT